MDQRPERLEVLERGLTRPLTVQPRQDLKNHSTCFLWTITLYHSTLSPMPTDRPVPVSIPPPRPPSPPSSRYFHFLPVFSLCSSSLLPSSSFFSLTSSPPQPSLPPRHWPLALASGRPIGQEDCSNVLPDQSRLWNPQKKM